MVSKFLLISNHKFLFSFPFLSSFFEGVGEKMGMKAKEKKERKEGEKKRKKTKKKKDD